MYVSNEERQAYQRRRLRYSAEQVVAPDNSPVFTKLPGLSVRRQKKIAEVMKLWNENLSTPEESAYIEYYENRRQERFRQERQNAAPEPEIVYYEAPAPRLNFLEKVLAFGAGYYAVSR